MLRRLEHHFGSESKSSKSSLGDDNDDQDYQRRDGSAKTSTSFINVTMKSAKSPRPRSPAASIGLNRCKRASERIDDGDGDDRCASTVKTDAYTTCKSAEDVKSRTATTKNVYEIQSGSIKKISADQRAFAQLPSPSSPFRPIEEKIRTERASSPTPISKLESSATYASIQRKHHRTRKADNVTSSSSSSSSLSLPSASASTKPAFNGNVNVLRTSSAVQSDQSKNAYGIAKVQPNS